MSCLLMLSVTHCYYHGCFTEILVDKYIHSCEECPFCPICCSFLINKTHRSHSVQVSFSCKEQYIINIVSQISW